ncbi:MAG: hypothetical protein PHI47_06390 [Sulfuricurvum sp.]|uniref:hypothetical protein n=1 Tax=Sulfuricurvum sp. TaxID=2025608 RepID=UPI0026104EEE|nr:hypothetical protein [Sulfuricurvum sp.]MDD5159662.1 hypothetical protein [Sulfuricurvum sp.]
MKRIYLFLMALTLAMFFAGCNQEESGEQLQDRQQAEQTKIAVQSTGMPSIINFTEKKNMKMILEMRDNAGLRTYTYMRDMNGNLHQLCDSIGYPIPYSTQYTNPQQIAMKSSAYGNAVLPQADPNGLYSPESAEGSYVMCLNPNNKQLTPVYVEERLITSPYKL